MEPVGTDRKAKASEPLGAKRKAKEKLASMSRTTKGTRAFRNRTNDRKESQQEPAEKRKKRKPAGTDRHRQKTRAVGTENTERNVSQHEPTENRKEASQRGPKNERKGSQQDRNRRTATEKIVSKTRTPIEHMSNVCLAPDHLLNIC